MRPEGALIAERALARHDPVLVRPGPDQADVAAALDAAIERLRRTLRGALARICAGTEPDIAVDPPVEGTLADLSDEALTAYSTYDVLPVGERMLTAIDATAVLRLVDRAFGGPGEAPSPLPRELPVSAELMVARIEAILAERLAAALAGPGQAPLAIRPVRRDRSLAQLRPFDRATRLTLIDITISEGTRAPWPIRLAIPSAALPMMAGVTAPASASAVPARAAAPDAVPFADVPLPVIALLVDTRLPLRTVSALEVGQVLALPIARSVPLVIGRRTLGHGAIGAVDDRVAIQMTQLA